MLLRTNSTIFTFLFFVIAINTVISANNLTNKLSTSIVQLHDLPQNDVNCIYQDSKGFIWIGTLDGLHRFDGYSYKTYQMSDEPGSISSNMIITIEEDSYGNIWVGTYGQGFCMLNPITEKFTVFNSESDSRFDPLYDNVISMEVDDQNVIWLGSWLGILRISFDENMQNIKEIVTIPLANLVTLSDDNVRLKKIYQDKFGTIWIGTNTFLVRLLNPYAAVTDIKTEQFATTVHKLVDYEDGLLVGGSNISVVRKNAEQNYELTVLINEGTDALIYRNQQIWSGNRTGISCFSYEPENGWVVSARINKENTPDIIQSNIVTSMIEDNLGQIWYGTRAGGMYIINLEPKRFKHYFESEKKGAVSSNFTRAVFEDHQQNLWIGTENSGVNVLLSETPKAYSSGFKRLMVNPGINEDRAYCIEEVLTPKSKQAESYIWVGTSHFEHLVAFNSKTFQKKQLPANIRNIGFVFALENQADTVLWAGTYGLGLWRFGLNENADIISSRNFLPGNKQEKRIPSNIIRDIMLDKNNNLWIATDNGLSRINSKDLNSENPEFQVFEKGSEGVDIISDYILHLHESHNGAIWMGTMGGGLLSYTKDRNSDHFVFSSVTVNDGLPSNTIKSILEDDRGNLWLSSNKGISKYNIKNKDVVNYDVDDGLQAYEFSELSAFKRASGEFVFGGINGFNVFYPGQMFKDSIKPKLFLTDFYLLNNLVKPGKKIDGKVILDKSIEYTNKLELKYKHNSFSLGFLGLHYQAPQKNRYKYILEGFDKDWYTASANHRIAKYTNVPPGDYVFKVKASNSDNIWTENPLTLDIKIRPHVTQSVVAYLIYIILLSVLGYLGFNILKNISSRKKRLFEAELEREKSEKLSQMKLRFFTNISHEFRTPLTLITTPIEKLIKKGINISEEERTHNYQIIKQNVNVMLRLINQLMDFRRVDQDKMKLIPDEAELNQFVRNICNSFEAWAENKSISFEYKAYQKSIMLWFDNDKLEKIIYNLLSNAFKYTPVNGQITVAVKEESSDKVSISVIDTGCGISPDEQEQVFERYYQSERKDKEHVGGTGIGLALTKSLVELHKGSIELTSTVEGSTFKVLLNKGHNWLADSEAPIDINESVSIVAADLNAVENELKEAEKIISSELAEGDEEQVKFKILIVEDNVELRKVVADIFIDEFTILEADDGQQGLKLCQDQLPDLVISDIMMPIMNGVELCQHIKNDEAISHVPVLLLTAKNTVEAQIEGYETGADAYIPKPFNAELLRVRAVSLIINRVKMRRKFQKEIEINPKVIANSPTDLKFLEQILALVEENLSETDFTVEKLAELYGVSRIYLNRKIKSLTGETANQFLRNIRLKHAAELLSQNVLTVSEVTWQVGYNDLRTFRTRFKEKFGVSPSEYAKKSDKNKE